MIQRIQTVYLLVAAVALASAAYLSPNLLGGHLAPQAVLGLAVFGLSAVVALGAIFLYGNRDRQRSVVLADQYLALAGLVGLLAYQVLQGDVAVRAASWSLTSWAPLLLALAGYALLWLGRRGVEADIKLIKSVDRLR